jgi:putative FmdB family regulatory protein
MNLGAGAAPDQHQTSSPTYTKVEVTGCRRVPPNVKLSGEQRGHRRCRHQAPSAVSEGWDLSSLSVPRYDFKCGTCGAQFEALVAMSEQPACTRCGAPDPVRLFSPIAGPLKTGLRGVAARRSNATRQAREDQRREGFAKQREQREQREH